MAVATAQNQISSNIVKTWLIMFFFSAFVVGVVYIFARAYGYDAPGALGMTGIALIMAGIMNFFSYYFSDKIVLAISGARQIQKKDKPDLFRSVENLAIASGLPMPKVYIMQDTAPNAFATGRDPKHAVVCFTTGILDKLNKAELEGVIAHELSHVKNRDTLLMTIVSVLVGLLALLADWFLRVTWYGGHDRDSDNKGHAIFFVIALVAAIIAPIIGTLIQLAISRRREYLADASAAYLTRDPEQLAYALQKISGDKEPLEAANRATAHLYITNPLKGSEAVGWFSSLFMTHPPIPERVKALMAMEGSI
ncbi:MAG: M48 family metallopeptidase [Candidatus Daviesbacteria bacterium]|nr:M48 family metallopeptidase [Candidatus Daviesbacteria bacterium]